MYLTDYREESLKDIIIKLEPGLFKKMPFWSKPFGNGIPKKSKVITKYYKN